MLRRGMFFRRGRRRTIAAGVRPGAADLGAATAELAAALPVLVLLLAVAVCVVSAVVSQLRCVDAARELARAAARGESSDQVEEWGRRLAPSGALVRQQRDTETVVVTVSAPAWPFAGPIRRPTVSGRAVALVEPPAP